MTVKQIFDSMEYGPAPESAGEALAWLVDQGDRFGHFIDGAFTEPGDGFESRNPATGEVLATLSQADQADVDAAVAETTALGGEIRRPPFDMPGIGRIAIVADPTGAVMGLMTPAEQG